MQQRLLERQELLVFLATCRIASAEPVPVSLPPVVFVDLGGVRGNVGIPCTALAPLLPLFLALQLEGAYVQQRFRERQELLVFGSNCGGAQPVPPRLPPLVLVDLVWG